MSELISKKNEEKLNEKSTFFINLLKKHPLVFISIIAVIGVALIVLPSFLNEGEPKNEAVTVQSPDDGQSLQSLQSFTEEIEDKIKHLVISIYPESNPQICVTVETGIERIYAYEERKNKAVSSDTSSSSNRDQNNEDTQKSIIILRTSDGSETPVLVKEIQPVIQGVVIILNNTDSQSANNVTEAVCALLNISSARVCVLRK